MSWKPGVCVLCGTTLLVAMSVDDAAVVAFAGPISARASLLPDLSPERTWERS